MGEKIKGKVRGKFLCLKNFCQDNMIVFEILVTKHRPTFRGTLMD